MRNGFNKLTVWDIVAEVISPSIPPRLFFICNGHFLQLRCLICLHETYISIPPKEGVLKINTVLLSLFVIQKSVKVIISMPISKS